MMFAQAIPGSSSVEIAAWLMSAFALAAGVNQLWKLVDRFKDKPPPSEILDRVATRFATKTSVEELEDDLRDVEQQVQGLRSENSRAFEHQTESIEGKIEKSRLERQHEIEVLHEKVNSVGKEVASLQASQNHTFTRVVGVDAKVDRLLERDRRPR